MAQGVAHPASVTTMGSFRGWERCYWCPYWVEDPYIIDWIGRPLCNWCFDWHIGHNGGPYEPTAAQRTEKRLRRFFPTLPKGVNASIAEFLRHWREP